MGYVVGGGDCFVEGFERRDGIEVRPTKERDGIVKGEDGEFGFGKVVGEGGESRWAVYGGR